jgi:hypothetical protein
MNLQEIKTFVASCLPLSGILHELVFSFKLQKRLYISMSILYFTIKGLSSRTFHIIFHRYFDK